MNINNGFLFMYNQSVKELEEGLHREIKLARNIQTALLNGKKPVIDGGEVSGTSIPARLIGGDYYDFYPLLNGKIRVVIGDVMGKGIPAAMLMILTRGAFRSISQATDGPGKTLTAMNNALVDDLRTLKSFVTVLCVDWDPKERTITYANAGHHLPIVCRNGEILELPKVKGIMLGALPNQTYEEQTVQLDINDFILLYTDGIIEAENASRERFQLERLIQTIKPLSDLPAEKIEEKIIKKIQDFTEGVPQKDDITLVILKILEKEMNLRGYNAPVIYS
jgi:sigma-B regulation protein RsbU (phosphoserine phosphatase)